MYYHPVKKYDHIPHDFYIEDYLEEKYEDVKEMYFNYKNKWNSISFKKKMLYGTLLICPIVFYYMY